MPTQQNVKKGSSRKVGNRKLHCSAYVARNSLMKNKLKRIARSNGLAALESYKRDKNKPFPSENKHKK